MTTIEWLSTADVAVLLGYSEQQVRRMCESGRFDGDRATGIPSAYRPAVGAHWRIPKSAVDLFVEQTRPKVTRRVGGGR